jgi:hypothetical protein
MSEDRLWKFRRPEWLNSIWARNAGVYAAGGLVLSPKPALSQPIPRHLLL